MTDDKNTKRLKNGREGSREQPVERGAGSSVHSEREQQQREHQAPKTAELWCVSTNKAAATISPRGPGKEKEGEKTQRAHPTLNPTRDPRLH